MRMITLDAEASLVGISSISAGGGLGGGSLNMRMITLDAKTSLVGISSISARVGGGHLVQWAYLLLSVQEGGHLTLG